MLRATRQKKATTFIAYLLIMGLVIWSLRHIESIVAVGQGDNRAFAFIYALSFGMLAWQTVLYMMERPHKTTMYQNDQLQKLRLIANVPVCNEDKAALTECLKSMLRQTRQIDLIHVVVNGPNTVDYTAIKQWALAASPSIKWDEQTIPGKRQAQALTVTKYLTPSDIFLSVDSDGILDPDAVKEGLKPLANPKVMSVAGVVLTVNNKTSKLARLSDLWFLVGQLVDRSAMSTMGSVLVNSGVLAFYRGSIMIDNLYAYTHETFFGRPVEFSDDSMLTIYALERGLAVQQPTSFCFTLMPEKMSHHIRQQIRWMRGAFIRSWWRFKYLPLGSYAYWGHLIGWMQMILSSVLFVYLFLYMPIIEQAILPYLLLIPILIGYAQALQYLTVRRSDESAWYRFQTFLCMPIVAMWSFFVLRFVRYYAIATCLKTGWGTRAKVEIGLTS